MYDIKWKQPEEKRIEEHIRKHIFNVYNEKNIAKEVNLWENEFSDRGLKLEELKEVGMDNVKPDVELYKKYNEIAHEVIKDNEEVYLFKTYSNYSGNFAKKNGLTTCVQIDFNESLDKKNQISSCFFRQSTVMNSSIIYVAKKMLEKIPKEQLFKINGVKTNNVILKESIEESLYDDTNNDKSIHLVKRFLFNYLKKQVFYYIRKETKIDIDLGIYSRLVCSLDDSHILSICEQGKLARIIGCFTDEKYIKYISDQLLKIKKFKEFNLFNELDIECEQVLLELCMKSIKENFRPKTEFVKELIKKGLF